MGRRLQTEGWYAFLVGLVALAFALLITFVPQTTEHAFRLQSHMTLLFCWLVWSLIIGMKLKNYWLAIPLMLAGISGTEIFAGRFTHFGESAFQLDAPSAQSCLWVVLVVTLVSFSTERMRDFIYSIYEWIAVITGALLLFNKMGTFDCISVDSAFVAAIYPTIFRRKGRKVSLAAGLIPIAAVAVNPSGATGIFALGAILIAAALRFKRFKLLIASGFFSSIVAIGYLFQGATLFNSSRRFMGWQMIMQWWWEHINPWFGVGMGTYQVLGPEIQEANKMYDQFFYLHNEYLQILFDQGIVGLLSCLAVYLYALHKAYRAQSWLFLSLSALGVVMLTQSPLRITSMCVFVALVVRDALVLD